MRKTALRVSLALLPLIALLILLPHRPAKKPPAPTEHRLREDAEERNRSLRREWIEQMHRAAPGTDWRAIERTNGAVRQIERNEAPRARVPRWTELGSRNLAGRMHAAALSASGDSLYGGSSRGGVWKASLNGEGWRPLSDNLFGGCHGVAVAEGPPEIVTAITDDGLLHYTEDGGGTWLVPTGPEPDLAECKRVLSDPGTPNRVYLLTRKDVTSSKLWISEDGGRTYSRIARLGANPGDIWLDRVSGGSLYLLTGDRTLRTDDAGATWDTLGLLPASNPTNVVLTGSEAGNPTLYAAAESRGGWDLYRSADGGTTWEYRHGIDDFWETLCASIADRDLILFAGVEMWRSTDGGASFDKVNDWWDYYDDPLTKLHADFPGTECVWGQAGEIFYISTDGGLYRSDDGVAHVTNISLEYLGVSQYYGTLTSANDPTLILAGSQDQGYQRSAGEAIGAWRDFDQLWSGDYGHLTSTDGSHNRVYSVYPGFFLVQKGETSPVLSSIDFPAGESYSWMPFILADPEDSLAFFFCASHLHRYEVRVHWTSTVSPQDFTVHGGLYLTALGISPVELNRRIAATNTGVVWYSQDGGDAWQVSPDNGPSAHYFYGTAVAFSPTDENTAYLGGSGYSGPAVYRTDDGGITWEPASEGLPSTLVYGLAFESPAGGALYAACEAGPFRRDPATGIWAPIAGSEAPLTIFWCVEAVPAANAMRFGTYGRGIWDYDTGSGTAVAAAEEPVRPAAGVSSYPNPFNATATIRFHLNESGPFSLAVYNAAGRRVRLLESGSLPAGEHEVVWDGRSDRGTDVASGVYTARLESAGRAWIRRMVLAR
ncbi:MAG: FlgD immunoglobulin-like domain containing protein [Candidatus Eisenbacteria bacterium]